MQVIERSHIEFIDIGDSVLCDYCNKDYSESDLEGGALVGSYAVCPECIAKGSRIKADRMCPEGMTFKEFVLQVRNGNDFIAIQTFD